MNTFKRNLFLLVVVGLIAAGCQMAIPVEVNQNKLIRTTPPTGMQLTMLSQAKDARSGYGRDQVGRHTWSVFMIPGFTVSSDEPLEVAIARRTRESLKSIGYDVLTVDKIQEAQGPVVVIQIDTLRNLLFSWLYPLGVTWGHMRLSVHLMSPEGDDLWQAHLKGDSGMGASLLYMSGFKTRVRNDLTTNVNQIVEILSSREFNHLNIAR
ncbi:MAG: hypothetical protein FJ119_13515 [Deltaproteobacteria bacterium]|nr:hypothetical protein [Deltaproteobacteria bacterium]